MTARILRLCAIVILVCAGVALAERRVPTKGNLKDGIRATLFNDDKFQHKVKERYDQNIDFNFGSNSPDSAIEGKQYSIRWFGWLDVPETGDYMLSFKVNGAVKLWIDDEQIIDFGSGGKDKETVRKVSMKQGLRFLRVDYTNSAGSGLVHFRWEFGKQKKQTIPATYFFHETGASN